MINEIKNIKLGQLSGEEIEYDNNIARKEEELKALREKEDKSALTESKEVYALRKEIEELKKGKEQWKKDKIESISNAKTLKDMGISFEEATGMLKERNMPIVLTEEDKVITENESEFEDMSDLMFVHKTRYFPKDSTIRTSKDAGAEIKELKDLEIDGQKYEVGGKSERETIHFTLNTEVEWNWGALLAEVSWENMKYTILIPGSEINEEQLLALRGEDSYFKGNIKLPEGAMILVPENEREILQKDNPEMQLIGYEGEPKDYGTAVLSSMGYKAEELSNEKRSWKNDKDISKVYEIAKSKGKSTLQHCHSKEINEECRGYSINLLTNVFKIVEAKIKENPNFANEIHKEKDLLNLIEHSFIKDVIKGQNDDLNNNICETEGIEELLEKFLENGIEFSEEQSQFMRETFTREQYEKMIEQYGGQAKIANEIFSNGFTGQVLTTIQQNIAKENEMGKSSSEVTERIDNNNLLGSAIEATEETTRSETVREQKDKIVQLQKERTQTLDNKDMSREE